MINRRTGEYPGFIRLYNARTGRFYYQSVSDLGSSVGRSVAHRAIRGLGDYISAPSVQSAAVGAVSNILGKRTHASYAGQVKHDPLNREFKKIKLNGMVYNKAGPSFNPGGAGGYLQKVRGRRTHKKHNPFSRHQKDAIRRIVKANRNVWERVYATTKSETFAVFTANAFPISPSGSTIANDVVGWYEDDLQDSAKLKALMNDGVRQDAYVASDAAVRRIVPNSGLEEERFYRFTFKYKYYLKNNGAQPAKVDVYMCRNSELNSLTPLGEVNQRYNDNYVLNTDGGIVAGTNPQNIQQSFTQFYSTKNQSSSMYNGWKIKKHYKAVLNPGDEATVYWEYTQTVNYNSLSAGFYTPGAGAVVFRVQGGLSHSEADERLVHYSLAQVDVDRQRIISIDTKDAHYTAKNRYTDDSNPVFVDDVVAGDATQHPVDQ